MNCFRDRFSNKSKLSCSRVIFTISYICLQDAAIFVFEKRVLEKYSRRDKDLITECLKKGASQLTRLRHPKVLSVIQPLEESR